jgi:hypothetical protein
MSMKDVNVHTLRITWAWPRELMGWTHPRARGAAELSSEVCQWYKCAHTCMENRRRSYETCVRTDDSTNVRGSLSCTKMIGTRLPVLWKCCALKNEFFNTFPQKKEGGKKRSSLRVYKSESRKYPRQGYIFTYQPKYWWGVYHFKNTHSPITLGNISSINVVSIGRCSSSTINPVYETRVDSSALVFSLSSHRHSYIGLVFSSRFID